MFSEGILVDEDFFPLAALAFVSSDDVAVGGDRYIFGEFVIVGVDVPIAPVHRKVFINIDELTMVDRRFFNGW